MGFVSFSSAAVVRFNLSSTYDSTVLRASILSQKYQNAGTATGHGLNAAYSLLTSASSGARNGPSVVILLTNYPSQESSAYLATAASNIQSIATVYAIGVGPYIPSSELNIISRTE